MRTILLALALVTSGCSVSGRVASEIEDALPKAIGPADDYQVMVEGASVRTSRADRVEIVGLRVAREGAPVIDRFEAVLEDVAFDRGKKEVSSVGSARATVRVVRADLEAYLGTQPNISNAQLTLSEPDQVVVRVRGELGNIEVPVNLEIRGRFVTDAGRVNLDISGVRAGPISMNGAAGRIEQEINPVLDLTDDDIALSITSVRVEGGVLVLEAAGDLSGLQISRVDSDAPRSVLVRQP